MQENTFADWIARENSAAATTDVATTDTEGSRTPGGDAFQKYIEQQKTKKTTDDKKVASTANSTGKQAAASVGNLIQTWWSKGPISMLTGTAQLIRDTASVRSAEDAARLIHPDQNQVLLDRIAKSKDAGNHAEVAMHTLNYALNGLPGFGYTMDEAGEKFKAGDYSGGVGEVLALATNMLLGMKGRQILEGVGKAADAAPSVTSVKDALSTTHDVYRVGKSMATGDPRGIAPAIRLVNKVKALTEAPEVKAAKRSTPETRNAESIALAKYHLAEVRRIMDQQGDPQDALAIRPGAREEAEAGTPGYVPKFLDSKPPIVAPVDNTFAPLTQEELLGAPKAPSQAPPAPDGIKLTPMRLTHPPENGIPPEAAAPPDDVFTQYELELLGQGKLNFRAPEAPPAPPPADGIRLTPMSLTHSPENFAQPVEEPPAPVPSQHDLELAGQGRLKLVTPSVQPPPAPVVPRGDGFALTHPPEIMPVAEPEPTPQPVSPQELELAGQRILPGVGPKHTEWIPPQPKPEGPAGHVPDYQHPLPGPDRFAELVAAQKQAEMEYAKAILEQRAKREATPLTKPDTATQPADTQPAVTATPPAAETPPAATTPAATPKGKGKTAKPKPPQKPLKAVVEETVAPDKSDPLDLESLIQQSLTEERIRAMRIRAAMGDSPVVSHDNQALNNELEARAGEDHQLYRAMTIDENAAALYKYLKSKGFKYEHVSKMMGDADFANWEMIAKEAQVPTPSKSVRVAVQKLMKKKV